MNQSTSKRPKKLVDYFLLWRMAKEPMYGYVLIDEIRANGFSPSKQATLYTTLKKLEGQGFIHIKKVEVDGRVRKLYTTTAAGKELLTTLKRDKIKGTFRDFIKDLLK